LPRMTGGWRKESMLARNKWLHERRGISGIKKRFPVKIFY